MPASDALPCRLRDALTGGKRARRKEARPGELLQAALELFVEKGFAATRAEDVAARAGVSKGTLFLYFGSKEELFKAVVTENLAGRFTEWNQEFETFEGSAPDMLRYGLHTWWERVGGTQVSGISKLMLSEGRNFPELSAFYHQSVVAPGNALVRRILERGIARGEFRALDVEQAVHAVVAPMLFMILWKHAPEVCGGAGTLVPEQYLAAQCDLLLRGLCTDAGHAADAAGAGS
ncbi:TetR/AcrR family transcriptional regulator [uncultured Variovorax sp.]|uniref:TetR/AcrR family transcriptional regulator n=1 Tax=uncultured Variovorax sp. TaxID=114708 RepID=UPI0025CDA35A|nr:TetR/AcrR family transcriptional regulator [uncultured Variovorax sp.]